MAENEKQNSGYGYTQREEELIQELVASRLAQKSELGFEDFDGYEVPPPTQFSMLKKPAVTIKYGKLLFNMASIRLFLGTEHVLPMVHPVKKRLTIVPCHEEEISSVQWARFNKREEWVNRDVSSIEFVERIFNIMEWNYNCRYKVLGRVSNSPRGPVLIFELEEAIMFTQAEEYLDEETGEIKKRQIKYFPDKYKDCVGKSYNDYAEATQLSIFEDFSGYGVQTYSDGMSRVQAMSQSAIDITIDEPPEST